MGHVAAGFTKRLLPEVADTKTDTHAVVVVDEGADGFSHDVHTRRASRFIDHGRHRPRLVEHHVEIESYGFAGIDLARAALGDRQSLALSVLVQATARPGLRSPRAIDVETRAVDVETGPPGARTIRPCISRAVARAGQGPGQGE